MWLSAVLCFLVAAAVHWYRFRCSRYYRLISKIPGPRGLPLLGNTIEGNLNVNRIMDFGKELRRKHGATHVLWTGPYAAVVLCDPRDVQIVLNKTETLSKSVVYKVPELFLGYGLITAGRSDWKRYHKLTRPAFSVATLRGFLPEFNKKSRVLVNVLRRHQNGQTFDVLKYMMMCTLDILTETSLGASMEILQNDRVELIEGLRYAETVVFQATVRPWCWSHRLMKKTSTYKAMVRGIQVLWDFAEKIINQKLANQTKILPAAQEELYNEYEESTSNMETKRRGFLDHVISCIRTDSTVMTKKELTDNTMTVIAGGTDTAAIVMSAVLMLLGLHQDVQNKVVEELEQIFADDIQREVKDEDLNRMEYLEQVINETMRLYPPLPITSRVVEEEVNITRYTLPTGTLILLPLYLVHREAAYFPDPDKFDPDRFSAEKSVGRHPYSFIPFLGGRRMCVGKTYAYMQMKTILSTVLRNYHVLPCGPREEMEALKFELTLRMVNGSSVKLIPRNYK